MLINERERAAVCIVGNANIDVLMKSIDEVPAWGTEKMVDSYEERLGGCAANSAVVLASLGQEVHIVATVGEDRHGDELRSTLEEAGVNVQGLKTGRQRTGMSLSLNRRDGERLFVTYPGTMFETSTDEIVAYLTEEASSCKLLLLTGYFLLRPDLDAERILTHATKLGMLTLFDTGWPLEDWDEGTRERITKLLPHVDYFLPNEMEACAIASEPNDALAAEQLSVLCRRGVIVKRGRGGSTYQDKQRKLEAQGYRVGVRDTVGAGDSYNAGFIYGLSQGWELARCLELGNAVAAAVISRESGFHVKWAHIHELLEGSSKLGQCSANLL
ncbi:carbohydrate kinase family protein [Paenibacillus sp. GCM10023252]|uniref:carbohydrate kinase family protein n=1 Tax=Paenibacillus sp. GCM10023252 TaxID=3252649 RepID=UPI00360C41D6